MDPKTKWMLKQPGTWLHILASLLLKAIAFGLVPQVGTWHQVVAGVLSLLDDYGFIASSKASPPRDIWTEEQKIAESLKRIAAGDPPLRGYEHLQAPGGSQPTAAADARQMPPPLPPPPTLPETPAAAPAPGAAPTAPDVKK
jgi:hypothetical protein